MDPEARVAKPSPRTRLSRQLATIFAADSAVDLLFASTPQEYESVIVRLKRYLRRLRLPLPLPIPERRFDLFEWDETTCLMKVRFIARDVVLLAERLGLPEFVRVDEGCRLCAPRVEALCIVLYRLAYPVRLGDMVAVFGRSMSALSVLFNHVVKALADKWGHLLTLDIDGLRKHAGTFSTAIARVSEGASKRVIGFVDGTGRPICRPTVHQEVMYSGHHRRHEMNYQVMVNPDGLARAVHGFEPGRWRRWRCHWCAPAPRRRNGARRPSCRAWSAGSRHDMYMLRVSALASAFEADPALQHYRIYGDKGYRNVGCIRTPYRGINLSEEQERRNARMGRVRVAVEWFFGQVVDQWQACAFRSQQKIWLSAIREQFLVAILLTNAQTCLRGSNEISRLFDLTPPTLSDYLGLPAP